LKPQTKICLPKGWILKQVQHFGEQHAKVFVFMQPRNPWIRKKSFFQPMSDSKKKPKTRATAHGAKETVQTSSIITGGNQKKLKRKNNPENYL